MSPEIHGALVGGALGGVVVLTGIWVESWLAGRRTREERRHRLVIEGTDVLNRARPLICSGGLLVVSPGSAEGQLAISDVQKVFDLGLDLFHSTRRLDPRGRRIRHEALDFIARWNAANAARREDKPYSLEELNRIDLARLRLAVWGRRGDTKIEQLVLHYRMNGLTDTSEM